MSDAATPRTRVLLIEDDDDNFSLTRDMPAEIPDHRYELNWARTYETGLHAIHSGVHDACLLDNLLGKQSGLELLNACGWGRAARRYRSSC
ncbi:MAG: response regulator of citrate/malate metabolism [Gammaproteobacteria bacterium]|jgi:response regulator of citrate/malate metabolism